MAAAPMNNNSEPTSDLQLAIVEWKPPILPEPIVTIAQLPPSKTSPLAPLTPSSELSGERKRKRLKPERLELSSIYVEKKRSFSKDKAVHDASRRRLRLGKENAAKGSKAPVKISQAMIRAREVQSTLGNEYPTFIKTMLGSHVTSCFWMGLPFRFGRSFLPKEDCLMVIEDENGERSNCKLIAYRYGLVQVGESLRLDISCLKGMF